MADALKTFKEGEDILASETNANNNYLLGKISDNASTLQNYVEGEVTSIQSSLASAQATLQNSINEITSKLGVVLDGIAPNWSAGVGISSGYTAPKIGWVWVLGYSNASGDSPYAYVDGKEVYQNWQNEGDGRAGALKISSMFFVGKGQKITTVGRVQGLTFYPCKGV
jgi:hypothetical protein